MGEREHGRKVGNPRGVRGQENPEETKDHMTGLTKDKRHLQPCQMKFCLLCVGDGRSYSTLSPPVTVPGVASIKNPTRAREVGSGSRPGD